MPVGIDDHAWVQQVAGIDQLFQTAHDGVAIASPLGFDERSHVSPGAVLRLKSAVIAPHHQVDHVVHEARVLVNRGLVVETLGDDEVQISVLGVAEDDGVLILMFAEEPGEVVGRVSQGFDGERDIFDDDGGAALAH